MDLFELNGRVVVNLGDALKAFDEIQKEGQKSESKLNKAFRAVGKGAAAVGKAIGTGLVAGGAAMGALTVKAMNLGGELEQNMGGSNQVFKEYAGQMQETAKTAFENMGLSTADFLGTANKMGALFQGAGFSIEESADLSANAMQRAADVASIMGIDTASAMEAIAGAAKGNFTMMDNLGVAMNDTAIQNYALSKGIEKSTSEMTQQEKIGLAMEMFMEKTAYAAGNYAKENETLAGSLGTAKAALTNFLDGSGDVDQLVGAFENAAKVIVKNVGEIAPRLITGITGIINQVVPMIPPLLNQLLPVIIEGAVSLIQGLASALPGLLDVLVNSALPMVLNGVVTIFNTLVTALPGLVQSLCAALPTLLPMLINGLVSMIVTLCEMIPQIIQPIIDYLPAIIISITEALVENLPALIQGIITLVMGIVEAIPTIIQTLVDTTPTTIEMIVTALLENLPLLLAGIAQLIMGIVKALPTLLNSPAEVVINTLKGVWAAIQNVFAPFGEWINANVVQPVVKFFQKLWNSITSIWNGVMSTTSNIWNRIKSAISNAVNTVKSTVSSVFNSVKSTVSNVFSTLKSTVSNIWNGIMNAIKTPIEKAKNIVKGAIDSIVGFFKGAKFNWPKIKMPKFSISPAGWKIGDLLEGKIPKLSIQWYAKAMDNPMIMDKPTIFGYNPATGSLMGGGEAGSEVVSGTSTLMNMIQSAVAAQNESMISVLTAILNAIVGGNQEMVHALLADKTFAVGEREFARLVKQYA